MADVELVIKIPERIHYGIEKGITVNGSKASQILIDAVKNATPLDREIEQEPRKIPMKWVDIHDRLPEGNDTDRVLVCYYDGFIAIHSVGRLRSTKDFVCEVAWMPLPKPYEPQESNDKGI